MKQNIALAANFTIEPIGASLELFLNEVGLVCQIDFAPYNQIFQELLNPASLFRSNKKGVNVLFLRIEDFIDQKGINFRPGRDELRKIQSNAANFLDNLIVAAETCEVPLLLIICPPSENVLIDETARETIVQIEESFLRHFENSANIYGFSASRLVKDYEIAIYDNPKANTLGHIPYTAEFFAGLGALTARKISAIVRQPHKVIVLDCDQTLWKGVCGEDGTEGVKFDPPWLDLQNFMVAQSEAGMVLCLCSKNNEKDVWDVFERRLEMPLKRDHIVSSRINWNFKSDNIKSLAAELNLGLNSFIFVDDDPVVCAEVEANCPEVLTLNLPNDPRTFSRFLNGVWAFDKLKVTKEDRLRAESYKQQVNRRRIQESSSDWNEFLNNLQLVCEISEMKPEQLPRVSQLSLRTNQFNSTTIRRSESDVKQFLADPINDVWVVNVRDRFGDYGLVGTMFFSCSEDVLEVGALMLSCRALGRGVEHKMVAALGKKALKLGLQKVNIRFIPTEKNAPILNFLTSCRSDYGRDGDNGEVIFKLPSEVAAKLTFETEVKPAELIKQTQKSSEKEIPAGETARIFNRGIMRIASHLNTAEGILQALAINKDEPLRTDGAYLAPQSETQKRLVQIWENILKLKKVSIRDDFFAIGGDSLAAVSLFVDVGNEFGKELPLSTLINAPTIEAMAVILEKKDSTNDWKYLVPLRTEGRQNPLFCMHAAGGNVLFYRDLTEELGEDQPVYGLQARGVADKSETAHEKVEDMAEEYLKEIRSIQPQGPYRLCGSSFGGLVAFEAAYQLLAEGEEVEILALFDTYAPGYPKIKKERFPFERKFRRVVEKSKSLSRQIGLIKGVRGKTNFVLGKLNKIYIGLKRKMLWKRNEFAVKYGATTGRELPVDLQRNHKAIQRALHSYQPKVYPETLVVFRAAEQPSDAVFDPTLGWKDFTTKPIEMVEVPGTHGALTVYPYAEHLAESLIPFLIREELRKDNKIEKGVELSFST